MNLDFVRKFDSFVGFPVLKILKLFNDKHKKAPEKINKIILTKFFGLGNLVMTLPCVVALRKKYPNAKIVYLTNIQNKGLLENVEEIDEVIYFNMKGLFNSIRSYFEIISKLRKEKFDVALDFEQFARAPAIMLFLSNIKYRIGFNTPTLKVLDRDLYNKTVPLTNKHMVEGFMDIISVLNIKANKRLIPLKINDAFTSRMKKDFKKFRYTKIVGIHPGTGPNADVRRWSKERFAKLCDDLISKKNMLVIFTAGSKSECDSVNDIISLMKEKNNTINMAGKTSISELSSLISLCDYYVSSDTGPIHIAAAQSTHCIGLYGPNTPVVYGPYTNNKTIFYARLACSPCMTNLNLKETKCKNNLCMQKITVKDVFDSIN